MGLVAVFGALALGAVRSLMAEPNVLSRHAFGSPGTGVGSGVSATSCVGVGLLTGGDVALGVLVGVGVTETVVGDLGAFTVDPETGRITGPA